MEITPVWSDKLLRLVEKLERDRSGRYMKDIILEVYGVDS